MADKVKEEIKGFIKEILAEHDVQIAQKYLSKAEAKTLVDNKNGDNQPPDVISNRISLERTEVEYMQGEDCVVTFVGDLGVEYFVNTNSEAWTANVFLDDADNLLWEVRVSPAETLADAAIEFLTEQSVTVKICAMTEGNSQIAEFEVRAG